MKLLKTMRVLSTIFGMILVVSESSMVGNAQQRFRSEIRKSDNARNDDGPTLIARMQKNRRPGFALVTPTRYSELTRVSAASSDSAVLGSGTVGFLPLWTDVRPNGDSTLGDSIISQSNGNIGIGTSAPGTKLTVQGMIETTLGGYKFPDGTVQTTAAISGLQSVSHDATLTGAGTVGSPLKVAVPLSLFGASTSPILTVGNFDNGGSNNGASGADIFGGRSDTNLGGTGLNAIGGVSTSGPGGTGLFAGGGTSSLGSGGTGLFAGGGFTNGSLGGKGVVAFGGINGTNAGGIGIDAYGGTSLNPDGDGGLAIRANGTDSTGGKGGNGFEAKGGSSVTSFAGSGVIATGGNLTGGVLSGKPGHGVEATGGDSNNGFGGNGVVAHGANFNGRGVVAVGGMGPAGYGVEAFGGASTGPSSVAGAGIFTTGGAANSPNSASGTGIVAVPGNATNGATRGRAGIFQGDVSVEGLLTAGELDVAGSKHFKIDHPLDPENKYLLHASVESSEVLNVYSGNIVTNSKGVAVVELPNWFEALNRDLRYQLTVIGTFAQAIVATEVRNNRFTIKTSTPNVKVSWQVTGVRSDKNMTRRPFKAEQQKSDSERGHYLQPELYNQPEERGIEWAQRHQMTSQSKTAQPDADRNVEGKSKQQ